jgi:hypothetical protein
MSKKIEKELDFAEYEIDEPEESKAAAEAAVNAAAAKVVKKAADVCNEEESDVVKKLRADLAAAQLALAAKSAPLPRVKYDHETTKKNLVKNTAPVRALMETHKNDYYAAFYMWTLAAHFMSLHNINEPENKVKKNAHAAFVKYFKKYQHEHGLPPATPLTAGSKTSSRTASRAASVIDEGSMDEDDVEDEEAGVCADSD